MAILAALVTGLQNYLRRVFAKQALQDRQTNAVYQNLASVVNGVTNVCFATWLLHSDSVPSSELGLLVIAATVGAFGVYIGRISGIWMAQELPLSTSETLIQAGRPVIVLIVAVTVLGEQVFLDQFGDVAYWKIIAVALLVSAIILISQQKGSGNYQSQMARPRPQAYLAPLIIVLVGSGAYLLQKPLVQQGVPPAAYILAVNSLTVPISVFVLVRMQIPSFGWAVIQRSLITGIVEGTFVFVGTMLFLNAIRIGDLSKVIMVTSTSMIIAILLGRIFSGDRVGMWRWLGIIMAVIGVALMGW